jgi:hypothetical protein
MDGMDEFTLADKLAKLARDHADGCTAITVGGSTPQSVVLVATDQHTTRVAVLRALHEDWYGDDDE